MSIDPLAFLDEDSVQPQGNSDPLSFLESTKKKISLPKIGFGKKVSGRDVLPEAKRTMGRTGKVVAGEVFGIPGDIASFIAKAGNLAAEHLPYGKPVSEEELENPFTSTAIKQRIEEFFPSLKPKNEAEKEWEENLGLGVGLAIPFPSGAKARAAMKVSKGLIPSKSQKIAYEFLKGFGLEDKAITPFIHDKKKASILTKWGKPFLSRENIKQNLSDVGEAMYGSIQKRGDALAPLSKNANVSFRKQFDDAWKDIPYFFKDAARKHVDVLFSKPISWKSLRDFEGAINNTIKGMEGGKAVIGKLKEPINFAERMMSPSLFKEKQLANEIYAGGKSILKTLPKKEHQAVFDSIDKLGALATPIWSMLSGNLLSLKGLAVKKGLEYAAAKKLTSPGMQSLRKRLAQSLAKKGAKEHSINLSLKLMKEMGKYLESESEEENSQLD